MIDGWMVGWLGGWMDDVVVEVQPPDSALSSLLLAGLRQRDHRHRHQTHQRYVAPVGVRLGWDWAAPVGARLSHSSRALTLPSCLAGAQKEGAAGFFKGVGKGLVGAVARPTGGIIDMASSTFQGIKR